MTVARHWDPDATVISVDGAFDADAARCLEHFVNDVEAGSPLTLDFREVRLFHDFAIGSLAAALSHHPDAHLVGLSEHQYRLLRYVDAAAAVGP
jgi:anti-anti-sigma regulatory factor